MDIADQMARSIDGIMGGWVSISGVEVKQPRS